MSNTAVYAAFMNKLAAFAAAQSLPKPKYPGLKFTPPDSGVWLESIYLPNRTQDYGLANNGPVIEMGIFIIHVCDRPDQNPLTAMAVAELLLTEFSKGTALDTSNVEAPPWISDLIETNERVYHPVTIRYGR